MIEVSRADFYAAVGGPEDIHPRSHADHSLWLDQSTHVAVGRTEPGYIRPLASTPRYYLTEAFAQRKGARSLEGGAA